MTEQAHLAVVERRLYPGAVWPVPTEHWVALQLCEGIAYVLTHSIKREMAPGMVSVTPPGTAISVLASTLGEALLRLTMVRVSSLCGVLTWWERRCLETQAARQLAPFALLPATHALASGLSQLRQGDPATALARRFAFLQAFAELAAPCLAPERPKPESEDPKARLKQLMNRAPESELASLTISQVAEQLRCCERHASRLFRELCGCSFRAYVSELRLQRACELLSQGNHKIIDVAFESGHGSLALFNYVFKKRFGMTPTEWRQHRPRPDHRPRNKGRTVAVLIACLTAWAADCPQIVGAEAPAASPAGQEAPASEPPSPAFEIKQYVLSGNTLVSTARAERLLSQFTGPKVDLETVTKAQAALQSEYLDRGYVTVVVSVPPQQITNGVIRMQVTEGLLADIKVLNQRHFSSNNVMRALPGLRTNQVLNAKLFQAELDRANANADRQIYPEVRPGPEPGTSALMLEVKDRFPLHGRAEVNNHNTPGTPDLRTTANVAYNNLWQREHALGLQYGVSPERTKGEDIKGLPLTPLDVPEIAYYSAFYRAPLSEPDSMEEEIARDPVRFGYNETTRQYVLPPAYGRTELNVYATRTTADSLQAGPRVTTLEVPLQKIETQQTARSLSRDHQLGLRLGVPLPVAAFPKLQSSVSVGFDFKDHFVITQPANVFYNTTTYTNEVGAVVQKEVPTVIPGTEVRQQQVYIPFSLGWNGAGSDPWGRTSGGLSLVASVRPYSKAEEFSSYVSPDADGRFATFRGRLLREQPIYKQWTVALGVEGQVATQPLVSLEQFALGGNGSVRGYEEGDVYGDNGWYTQVELRAPTLWRRETFNGRPLNLGVSTFAFTDYGQTYLIDPRGRQGSTALWGAGLGATLFVGTHWEGRITFGFPLLESAQRGVGDLRFTFAVSGQF